jgi:hypothetical protein
LKGSPSNWASFFGQVLALLDRFILEVDMVTIDETLAAYHKDALTALQTGEANFGPHKRFRAIWKHYDARSDDPAYLEILIMAAVFARARPQVARQSLRKLRSLRLEQENLEAYTEFENLIAENKAGTLVGNHGYTVSSLADVDQTEVFRGVQSLVEELGEMEYQLFANSGTLLGLIREKSLISYDDDIDLFVFLKASSHEGAAKEFVDLAHQLKQLGHKDALNRLGYGIIKLREVSGIVIDLFPSYMVGDFCYIYPYSFGDLRIGDIYPKRICETSGLPIPNNAEAVLQANYGDDWRTPVRLFEFPWVSQNEKFFELRAGLKSREA